MADYIELTKPGVTSLILLSTAVGFYLGSEQGLQILRLIHTLVGTALVASGTATLNQYWERDADAKMWRTRNRPLPMGRLAPWKALGFGIGLSVVGSIYLWQQVNALSAGLAALTLLSYLFFYTPLKTRTPMCTLVGSFPGAIPPLIGWAAAHGSLTTTAWVLYGILFLWQFPHFYSIAWLYRDDYERAGIAMLPVVEPDCKSTARQIVMYATALLPVSLIPTWLGITGAIYLCGAFLLGMAYLYFAVRTAMAKNKLEARRLLQASVIYLPLVYGLMLIDKTIR
ncbi:MAG: protoheme IX farnesyltransferase [Acidobacteria bacterium]|nr:protoheme IX farnesyltransferase [Acidobacteriota bacterium]